MSKIRRNNVKNFMRIISLLLTILAIIFSGLIVYMDILPTKYFYIFIGAMILLNGLFMFILFKKSFKIWLKSLIAFLSVLLMIVYSFGSYYIFKTYDIMDKINSSLYTLENYYIIVKSDSTYTQLNDLENKEISTYKETNEVYDKAIAEVKNKIDFSLEEVASVKQMVNNLLKDKTNAIIISEFHKDDLKNDFEDFDSNTKVLETIKIKVKNQNIEREKIEDFDITSDAFNIYVSGIDTYGEIALRSRSDVNMIITINANTHEILLTSIPRDYYVRLHNTEGYKDKLTHAGIYGVNMSMDTLEDLLDIDLNYYVRVNFTTLVNAIDLIGGVDIYSDASFVPWTNPALYIHEGMNHMDGAMALAFSRERMSYLEGDRHRVLNQQNVISAVIKKMTTSTALITKYTSLLDSLSTSFQTDVDMNDITELIKAQIDTMPNWTIKNYSLNGSDSSNYTYSFGEQLLYVMEPEMETVTLATKYINGMMKGQTFIELGL